MKASDIMTPAPLTIRRDAEVSEIARLILEHRISAVPVVDGAGKLVGLVSASDLLQREELGTAPTLRWLVQKIWPLTAARQYVKARGTRAEHVMSRQTVTVDTEAPLTDVIRAMVERGIQRVVVVDGQKPVGILSRRDVLRAILAQQTDREQVALDETIRQAVAEELHRQPWFSPARVSFSVKDGVVTFDGVVHSKEEKQAICIAAECASGVRRVVDRTIEET